MSKEQLKWKVPEKECYAIFWSFKKLEYLIRDIKFTLHTDHRNLAFLKTAGSDKILRWKLEIQGYNCRVIFIKGEDNMVADGFSRFGVTNFDEEENDNTTEFLNLIDIDFHVPNNIGIS